MTDEAPSKHTTRQEVEKAPRTTCRLCGMSGVSAMVKGRECVNVAACEKRQRILGKMTTTPKKKAGK